MDGAIQSYGDVAMTQMASAPGSLASLPRTGADIDKASQDFEAMFMTQMLQPMFDGLGSDPVFGGGHGEEVMRTFLLQEYGKLAAKSGQLGITPAIKSEMIKMQAAASDPANPKNANRPRGASYAATR